MTVFVHQPFKMSVVAMTPPGCTIFVKTNKNRLKLNFLQGASSQEPPVLTVAPLSSVLTPPPPPHFCLTLAAFNFELVDTPAVDLPLLLSNPAVALTSHLPSDPLFPMTSDLSGVKPAAVWSPFLHLAAIFTPHRVQMDGPHLREPFYPK